MHLLTVSLIVLGAGIIVGLGTAHAVFTVRSSPQGGPMTPTDPGVRDAMIQPGGLGLAPWIDSPLWKAWMGFNLSHSLGVVAIGLLIGVPALIDIDSAVTNPGWVAAAVVAPPLYLGLSVRYWFRSPTVGIGLATGLILVGLAGQAVL